MQFGTPINTVIANNMLSSEKVTNVKGSLVDTAMGFNYPKYSLYKYSDEEVRDKFLNSSNLRFISDMITLKLEGVHPKGKKIVVPDQEILKMMTNVSLNNYYDIKLMNEMVINIIVNYIKDEFEVSEQNNKLNIWVTQYTSDTGLRRNPEIKIREKHPTRMVFNMNY